MLEQIPRRASGNGGHRQGYDTKDFVAECRNMRVTPHVAQKHEAVGRQRDG
jgi:hypothetical protein